MKFEEGLAIASLCSSMAVGECSFCDMLYFQGGEDLEVFTREFIMDVAVPHMLSEHPEEF